MNEKKIMIYLFKRLTTLTNKDIRDMLNINYLAVSKAAINLKKETE